MSSLFEYTLEKLSKPLLILTGFDNINRIKDLNPHFVIPAEKDGAPDKLIKNGKELN
jgi:hypothetical protein